MSSKKNLFKNINSYHLLLYILSFIEKRRSLDIISHNKRIQKKIKLTLEDYKNISGKYIKHEREKLGFEEYDWVYTKDTNYIIFKGKYFRGKKMDMEQNFTIIKERSLKENI